MKNHNLNLELEIQQIQSENIELKRIICRVLPILANVVADQHQELINGEDIIIYNDILRFCKSKSYGEAMSYLGKDLIHD